MRISRLAVVSLITLGACWPTFTIADCTANVLTEPPSNFDRANVYVLGAVQRPSVLACNGSSPISSTDAVRIASGLAGDAFPYGAVLLRLSRGPAFDLVSKAALTGLSSGGLLRLQLSQVGEPAAVALVEELRELEDGQRRKSRIRIPVVVESALKRRFPERDVRLQAGDILYVPRRPQSLLVMGAVRAPGVVSFRPGASAREYLDERGGTVLGANVDDAFVYSPDGSLFGLSISWWKYQRSSLAPGSLIIVPYRNGDPVFRPGVAEEAG